MRVKKIRYFVRESPFLSVDCKELEDKSEKDAAILRDYINKLAEHYGWGNGYAVIPPEHPLYGDKFDRDLLNFEEPITLSDYGKIYTHSIFLKKSTTAL